MFRAIDHPFVVECNDPALESLIGETFAHCWVDDTADPDETLQVTVDGDTTTLRSRDGDRAVASHRALQAVVSTVNLRGAQRRSHDLPVLHGGAVAVEGEATVLLGPSGSGKSTLVAALVAGGAQYLADELLAVRSATCVGGYPKSITLKTGSWAALPFDRPTRSRAEARFLDEVDYVTPEHAGSSAVIDEAVPTALVLPTWTDGQRGHRMEPLSVATTLLKLCETAYRPVGAGSFVALAELAARCPGFQLTHGDTQSGVTAVASLDRNTPPAADVIHLPMFGADPICAASFGDEAVLMRLSDGRMALIDNPEPAVWSAAIADPDHPLGQIFSEA